MPLDRNPDDPYLDTVARLEPDIAMIDTGAGFASIAISLKRIADTMERLEDFLLKEQLSKAAVMKNLMERMGNEH